MFSTYWLALAARCLAVLKSVSAKYSATLGACCCNWSGLLAGGWVSGREKQWTLWVCEKKAVVRGDLTAVAMILSEENSCPTKPEAS